MSEMITIHNLPKQPTEHAKPIKAEEPLTIGNIVQHRVPIRPETIKKTPILTLHDITMSRNTAPQQSILRSQQIDIGMNRAMPAWWSQYQGGPLWTVLPKDSWNGRSCFIVGGGPSLKEFNWDLLKGRITIGINRAFEKFDPTIMFCMDPRVWGWIVRGDFGEESTHRYEDFKGYKVWINATNFVFPDGIQVVSLHELSPCGSNSGHAAINLAILLGASPIYLLGFDMRGNGKGGQKWFHDGYPVLQPENVYNDFIEALNKDADRIKETGTRVVNLTPRSALKCFPTGKITDVITSRGEDVSKPIVISYYTENTTYEKEAERLIRSAIRFGMEYDVVPKPNMGGWKANTYYKAEFIREMLDKHPDRNLLWIDADATIEQYPALFDDMDEDMGIFIADWSKIGGYKRRLTHKKYVTDTEVLSGTIYIANNPRSKAFIDAWVALNKKNYARCPMEQTNLEELVYSWKEPLTIKTLPPSYCQIWDTMAYLGDPVIEHFQAARRLKGEVGR